MGPFRNDSRGSITLVALSLAIVIGISLASYIALCQQSLQLSTRNIQLGKARQLAETGLEEALWALNTAANPDPAVAATAWKISTTVPTIPAASVSWTTAGADISCTITGYDLGEGTTGQIDLKIRNFAGNAPTITSTASINAPALGNFTKTLTATTRPAPLFVNAIGVANAAPSNYLLLFGGTRFDSWNSNPGGVPYSFTGAQSNYAATIAAPSIQLNNTVTIYGYVATVGTPIADAGSPLYLVKGPATPPSTNIDPARVSKSAFVPSLVVSTPTGAAVGNIDGTAPPAIIDNSAGSAPQIWDASPSDLILNGATATVTIKGHVIIRVPGNLSLLNGAKFVIYKPASPGPDKGVLEIYVDGDFTIDAASQFQNDTLEPKNLAIFSTNSGQRIFQYASNQNFCGVMYSASIYAGSHLEIVTSPDFYGAILAQHSPSIDNNPYFHYDVALQSLPRGWFTGVTTPFIIVQITES